MVKTDPKEWTVSIVRRVPAPYKTPVESELITLTFSYRGGEQETLTDCPFEAGITEDDLRKWLANRENDVQRGGLAKSHAAQHAELVSCLQSLFGFGVEHMRNAKARGAWSEYAHTKARLEKVQKLLGWNYRLEYVKPELSQRPVATSAHHETQVDTPVETNRPRGG